MPVNPPIGLHCIWQKFKNTEYPFESHISSYNNYVASIHSHDYPQLFYCLQGEYLHCVNNEEYYCKEGSLIIIPPGNNHTYKTKNCTLVQINTVLNFFNDFSADEQLTAITYLFLPVFNTEIKFTPQLYIQFTNEEKALADDVFTRLAKLEWKNHVSTLVSARKLFCSLFSSSPFTLSPKARKNADAFLNSKYVPLLRSAYYINLNYSKKISADELAKLSQICRTDYFRYFKRMFGVTYSQYLSCIRLSHAALLCKFSRYSFSYIADICGFSSHAHMDTQMKKYYNGRMPSSMRRERNANITDYPNMIMTRSEYSHLPPIFNSYGL